MDPAVLRSLDATPGLAKALLGMRGRLSAQMRDAVREVEPQETANLAGLVARLRGREGDGESPMQMQMHYETSEEDLRAGTRLELSLADYLRRDGLGTWVT